MNLLQSGATWLGQKLQASAGRTVNILQGTNYLSKITAALVTTEFEVIDESGFLQRVKSFDWTFVAADLPGFKFKNGTEISETVNGCEVRYEALPMGDKPCVEFADTSGILLTVHSKLVS